MKILVFGADVIGTMHAWAFQQAGHDVSLLARAASEDRWANVIALGSWMAARRERITQAGRVPFQGS